jgi:hypothetical protein
MIQNADTASHPQSYRPQNTKMPSQPCGPLPPVHPPDPPVQLAGALEVVPQPYVAVGAAGRHEGAPHADVQARDAWVGCIGWFRVGLG